MLTLYLNFPNTPISAVCVRMALWYAPSFPARCTSLGAHGAPAQPHVGVARGRGCGSARKQRVVLPAVTLIRQRSVICHRVQV